MSSSFVFFAASAVFLYELFTAKNAENADSPLQGDESFAYGKATVYDDAWSNPAAPTGDGPLYCGYWFDAETGLSSAKSAITMPGYRRGLAGIQSRARATFTPIVMTIRRMRRTRMVTFDEFTYNYDRAGDIRARNNVLNSALNEIYAYDNLHRLTSSQRADSFDQSWGLDGQGNFSTFNDDGVLQTRDVNEANEIEGITGGSVLPQYDAAGNMISGPNRDNNTV
ncbi:MAG TPA: hypothetical protein VIH42_02800, partial [Thermoguttaceae bacterium]